MAALDPLARREFLGSLAAAVADAALTVLLSSHLLADLERVCDHLILLAGATPVICAEIDDLLASHKLLTGPRALDQPRSRANTTSSARRAPRGR